jgi:hypothetical protein
MYDWSTGNLLHDRSVKQTQAIQEAAARGKVQSIAMLNRKKS